MNGRASPAASSCSLSTFKAVSSACSRPPGNLGPDGLLQARASRPLGSVLCCLSDCSKAGYLNACAARCSHSLRCLWALYIDCGSFSSLTQRSNHNIAASITSSTVNPHRQSLQSTSMPSYKTIVVQVLLISACCAPSGVHAGRTLKQQQGAFELSRLLRRILPSCKLSDCMHTVVYLGMHGPGIPAWSARPPARCTMQSVVACL